jgi:hypothetical protein
MSGRAGLQPPKYRAGAVLTQAMMTGEVAIQYV